mmetsp:Transcript_15752/g.63451  ORF Transcript_15752/g.63451 Transcript_15752/m.63451 type:complete len:237 (-) Transcript_15752:57-767(-)
MARSCFLALKPRASSETRPKSSSSDDDMSGTPLFMHQPFSKKREGASSRRRRRTASRCVARAAAPPGSRSSEAHAPWSDNCRRSAIVASRFASSTKLAAIATVGRSPRFSTACGQLDGTTRKSPGRWTTSTAGAARSRRSSSSSSSSKSRICRRRAKGVSGSTIFWRVPRSRSCNAIVGSSHLMRGLGAPSSPPRLLSGNGSAGTPPVPAGADGAAAGIPGAGGAAAWGCDDAVDM